MHETPNQMEEENQTTKLDERCTFNENRGNNFRKKGHTKLPRCDFSISPHCLNILKKTSCRYAAWKKIDMKTSFEKTRTIFFVTNFAKLLCQFYSVQYISEV